MQLTTIRSKLSTSTVGSGSMYHANLMKTLEQKDRVIEKLTRDAHALQTQQDKDLKQPRETLSEQSELVASLNARLKELGERLEAKSKEAEACQNEAYDLKDEVEMLRTQLLRKDSHVNSLELSLTQKNEEIEMMEEKLGRLGKQQQQQIALQETEVETARKQVGYLQREVAAKEAQVQNLLNEVRLFRLTI